MVVPSNFDNLEVPVESLLGEEGKGFRYLLDGLNAERILIAAECVGDGRWFVERAINYANDRVVFNRPISKNQGIQFPIVRALVAVEQAELMLEKACRLYSAREHAGAAAIMAKLVASEASWQAAILRALLTRAIKGHGEHLEISMFESMTEWLAVPFLQPRDTGFPVVQKFALSTSQVDLFRYSAFTGNGHRIHYDLRYARDLEGYSDLVVHGPYLVSMLVEQALALTGLSSPRQLEYRLTQPLFQSEGYEIAFGELEHEQMKMAIINGNGQVTLSACLTFDLSRSGD
jgi:hypothetical protein